MDQLVNFIIRPPRADYIPKNDLLDQEFMLKGRWFQRKDLEVINRRGNKLQCSHYMPLTVPEGKRLPCVIYCHGNSGCRVDASEAAIILLPSNITVFTLDFSGSGLSEGEHVTLGWNEKDDLRAVIDHLRTDESVSYIGLWGRSMGAVTSLMYAAEDPSVAGMVLDSPFSVLVDLMMELVDTYKYPLPKFTVKLAIQHMRKVIKKKANFDIMDLDTIQVAKCCFVPVLLGHATDDDFIRPHHSDQIYDSYAGDKNIIKFDGDHNSPRPQFYFDSITIFFHNVLHPPRDVFDEHGPHAMHEFFDKDNWETIHDIDYRNYNIFNESSGSEPVASSTEDAINRLRARRPISRTEVPADISADVRQFETQVSGQLNTATTNDEYVEYAFGLYGDMPCSMEDEERMLMEAILQSLKDTVVTNPQEQDAHSNSSTSQSIQSSNSEASPPDCSSSSCAASSSTAEPGTAMPKSYFAAPVGKSFSSQESSTSNGICSSADGNTSAHDADTSGRTRATLVVEKHGTGDGFAQRWGLNFFKNSSR